MAIRANLVLIYFCWPRVTLRWSFEFRFRVLISSFDFECWFRVSISSFDFEFRFRVLISSFDFEFRFRVLISSFDFECWFRVSISSFDFEFWFRVMISSFDFQFQGTVIHNFYLLKVLWLLNKMKQWQKRIYLFIHLGEWWGPECGIHSFFVLFHLNFLELFSASLRSAGNEC